MGRRTDPKKREFLRKAAYSAPAIISLQAVSSVAKAGSEKPLSDAAEAEDKEKKLKGKDKAKVKANANSKAKSNAKSR